MENSDTSSTPAPVVVPDVCCGPWIGFFADAASVYCVVSRRGRGRVDGGDKMNQRERPSCSTRRMVDPEPSSFMDYDHYFEMRHSGFGGFGSRYHRHVRHPSPEGLAEYDRSITPTKNIGLPDSLLSRFDLLFIVLDQMDPDIDRQISEHVLRMHRFRSATDGGEATLDGSLRYGAEEEADIGSSVYVKYNRMLHGKRTERGRKRDTLTIKFLKKYIHYAKQRIQPDLTDEASDNIATAYAELKNASSNAKTGGGTLPITARTLETIIRLSTAHAKLKLSRQVLKSDVEAALKVLNFAIYHTELNEMEERENQRERELERKRKADHDGDNEGRADHGGTSVEDRTEAMEVDEPPAAQPGVDASPERIEAFNTLFGQHVREHHLDRISISDIQTAVNNKAAVAYSRQEIMFLLEG